MKSTKEEKRHVLNLLISLTKRESDITWKLGIGKRVLQILSILLVQYDDSDKILGYICDTIHRFCKNCNTNQRRAIKISLHKTTMQVFANCKNPNLLQRILFALNYLFQYEQLEKDTELLIELIITKMKEFPDKAGFQMTAAFMLIDLAEDHMDLINILEGGTLVKAALRHSDCQNLINGLGW